MPTTTRPGWGPHHLRFGRIDRRTLDATDRYFRSRPWRGDTVAKAQRWVAQVATVYRIDAPTVRHVSAEQAAGLGCYRPWSNQILLPYASATTLFHEFRHAMQHHGWAMVPARYGGPQPEEDARAWSLSLFYRARPQRFARMVRADRILYVPVQTVGHTDAPLDL